MRKPIKCYEFKKVDIGYKFLVETDKAIKSLWRKGDFWIPKKCFFPEPTKIYLAKWYVMKMMPKWVLQYATQDGKGFKEFEK